MRALKNRSLNVRGWRWLVAAVAVAVLYAPGWGKPFNWGDNIPSQKWPNDKAINVFLPEHPNAANGTANDQIKEGMERWTAKMAPYGITFNFILHEPQDGDPTTNRVVMTWVDDGDLGADEGEGRATSDGTKITGGTIKIEKDNRTGNFLKNLGMHELGHCMGLDDDTTGAGQRHNCMDHTVSSTGVQGFTARDCKEIESLYGTAADKEQADGTVTDASLPIDPELWQYEYLVTWTSGPEIPIFEMWINVNPALVQVIEMPPGWELDFPPQILDGIPVPTPTHLTRKLHFFALDPLAPLQGTNPQGNFVILVPAPPGPGLAHAMIGGPGNEWTLFPVQVPTLPCPQDVNGDGVINVLDLIDLLLCFGQPAIPGCETADIDGSGTVNVLDLIDLLLVFGQPCR